MMRIILVLLVAIAAGCGTGKPEKHPRALFTDNQTRATAQSTVKL